MMRSGLLLVTILLLLATASASVSEQVLWDFGYQNNPYGGLVARGGNLYGTTYQGGVYGSGNAYELKQQNHQWSQEVLYSFMGGGDGAGPQASMIFDSKGNLYGTTLEGGGAVCGAGYTCGTVFELQPNPTGNWTEIILHVFTGGLDGGFPSGPLVFDNAGNLYGTTQYGGNGNCNQDDFSGCGTVFELTPNSEGSWTESVLYNFQGGTDGYIPQGGVVFDTSGNLYGVTQEGGNIVGLCQSSGCGTVFELTQSGGVWNETQLHVFTDSNGSDGIGPYAGVIIDKHGNLYGTTAFGGTAALGTVFQVSPGCCAGTARYHCPDPSMYMPSWPEHKVLQADVDQLRRLQDRVALFRAASIGAS
jgi:uncharacterized repeat protein (TIGR03803 family)